jgi:hypothetical protein
MGGTGEQSPAHPGSRVSPAQVPSNQHGPGGRGEIDMKTSNNSKQLRHSRRCGNPMAQLLMQIAANLAWNAC